MTEPVSANPHTVGVRGDATPLSVGKIVALGRNYAAHAREMGAAPAAAPLLFLKPASALVADGGVVRRPSFSSELHHEVELVVAIGRGGSDIPVERALEHVLGFAIGIDLTLRDVQAEAKRRGHPWAVAKGFDTSAPVSEIVPVSAVPAPEQLEIELRVNDELRQHGRIRDMITGIPETIAYVSQIFTLDRGDLIFTGTPEGVAAVEPGDRIEARLVGQVSLEVRVAGGDG
jgi:2-keto-4-pentenoate hydratase/2-oxohepta-3-ene-1,7-dioic acid hydratase in catechol pathway